MEYHHDPVLLHEVLEYLNIRPGITVIDCTVGGGGHTRAILERIGQRGRVLGFDQDADAIAETTRVCADAITEKRLVLVHDAFDHLEDCAREHGVVGVDAILFDLGASSHHFGTPDRGFSFAEDGPLDMRFDQREVVTAAEIVNTGRQETLEKIFREYGDERYARDIATAIVRARRTKPITRTIDLANLIVAVYRQRRARDTHIHPATRVFQALRIAVNDELGVLERALPQALRLMKSGGPASPSASHGGRLGLITFHSLEDRIVKDFFRRTARGCVCPPQFPVCRCGQASQLRIVTRKGIHASVEEVRKNPRARSATLRVAEKVEGK